MLCFLVDLFITYMCIHRSSGWMKIVYKMNQRKVGGCVCWCERVFVWCVFGWVRMFVWCVWGCERVFVWCVWGASVCSCGACLGGCVCLYGACGGAIVCSYGACLVGACVCMVHVGVRACAHEYPRVTSFDALKQLTDICAHLITFSSRKYIILNKLSCFKSKHTLSEVSEHLFCLKYRCQRV